MNFLKDEIDQLGGMVEKSIRTASVEIQGHVDRIGAELTNQRTLTTADLRLLIDYAADRFGSALDERVKAAKTEIASLLSEKVAEIRTELTEAATEQKRTALRNASVAVLAAIAIGLLSLAYKRVLHGEVDLMTVFRAVLAAIAGGHAIWLLQRAVTRYYRMSRLKRNVLVASAQYFGVIRGRGVGGHLLVLVIVIAMWATLNFWPQVKSFIH